MGLEIYDLLYGVAVLGAVCYTHYTSIPEEFIRKAAAYTGIQEGKIDTEGAIEVLLMRLESEQPNKEFFRRKSVKALLRGENLPELEHPDCMF